MCFSRDVLPRAAGPGWDRLVLRQRLAYRRRREDGLAFQAVEDLLLPHFEDRVDEVLLDRALVRFYGAPEVAR